VKLRIALLLSALSGFIALSYEIVWIRIYTMASWGKASAFGVLLGAYLAGLAGGALLARRFCRDDHKREMRALALFVLGANLLGFLIVPAMAELVRFTWYYWALPLVALSAALLGTTFPLIAHFGVPPDERVGARVSYLYGANIIGSTFGSLLTGLVLLDVFSLNTIADILVVCGVLLAIGVARLDPDWGPSGRKFVGWCVVSVCAVMFASPFLFDGFYEKLQFKDEYTAGTRFELIVESKSGVVTVTKDGRVFGGGVYDGVFSTDPVDDRNGIFRAYAPLAFRPEPRDVLVIGLGSGSWTQVIANHPTVKRIVAVEISHGYLKIIEHSPVVRGLLTDPRVELVVDDGRRWMLRNAERFDWIIQNTTYHFRAHATNLLSREYFELCRTRLKPGGIVLYNTTKSLDAQKTGLAVFPHTWLIGSAMLVSDKPLVPDMTAYRGILENYEVGGRAVFDRSREADRAALEHMLADERWHDRAWLETHTRDARVITDDNMASEWAHLR